MLARAIHFNFREFTVEKELKVNTTNNLYLKIQVNTG